MAREGWSHSTLGQGHCYAGSPALAPEMEKAALKGSPKPSPETARKKCIKADVPLSDHGDLRALKKLEVGKLRLEHSVWHWQRRRHYVLCRLWVKWRSSAWPHQEISSALSLFGPRRSACPKLLLNEPLMVFIMMVECSIHVEYKKILTFKLGPSTIPKVSLWESKKWVEGEEVQGVQKPLLRRVTFADSKTDCKGLISESWVLFSKYWERYENGVTEKSLPTRNCSQIFIVFGWLSNMPLDTSLKKKTQKGYMSF